MLKKVLIIMCLLAFFTSCGFSIKKNDIKTIVQNLGLGECPICDIEKLYSNPHEAAQLLIKELHAIEVTNERSDEMINKNPASFHVIWCVRGLQFLTGQRFFGDTKETNSYRIQQFQQTLNPLPFYRDWMSREYIMIAPHDVQIQIINKWKEFIKQNPKFTVKKYSFNDDLYF
jgi:hypothetical protein